MILSCAAAISVAAEEQAMTTPEAKTSLSEQATFAGGCFWCMESPFDETPGVLSTTVGYTGGKKDNPTYEEVSSGSTGHTEAVLVEFDPAKVSYETLLDVFWRNIDPTQADGQFADRGSQYRTAIFFHSPEQKESAERSKAALQASGKFQKPIAVEISPSGDFYRAEEYHQDYYKKNEVRYKLYKVGSGRQAFIEKTWDKK